METEIYYFSGTGNSLAAARDIADKISGQLIPISSVINKDCIKTNADMIGIIYPVYHQGIGSTIVSNALPACSGVRKRPSSSGKILPNAKDIITHK